MITKIQEITNEQRHKAIPIRLMNYVNKPETVMLNNKEIITNLECFLIIEDIDGHEFVFEIPTDVHKNEESPK